MATSTVADIPLTRLQKQSALWHLAKLGMEVECLRAENVIAAYQETFSTRKLRIAYNDTAQWLIEDPTLGGKLVERIKIFLGLSRFVLLNNGAVEASPGEPVIGKDKRLVFVGPEFIRRDRGNGEYSFYRELKAYEGENTTLDSLINLNYLTACARIAYKFGHCSRGYPFPVENPDCGYDCERKGHDVEGCYDHSSMDPWYDLDVAFWEIVDSKDALSGKEEEDKALRQAVGAARRIMGLVNMKTR